MAPACTSLCVSVEDDPANLFETRSFILFHCVLQAGLLHSPVSTSDLSEEVLGLQICPSMPSFRWVLGVQAPRTNWVLYSWALSPALNYIFATFFKSRQQRQTQQLTGSREEARSGWGRVEPGRRWLWDYCSLTNEQAECFFIYTELIKQG